MDDSKNGHIQELSPPSGIDEKRPIADEEAQRSDSSLTATTPAQKQSIWNRIFDTIYWVPPNCRYDPDNPPVFSMAHNLLFGFAGAFTVANLYYSHPILNILAHDFGVDYQQVADIPTLAQGGYATGLLFLCPLGDLLKRRPFVLTLVLFTATVCIGLCLTKSVHVFCAIQFITAVTTVTPQLMMPLVGDLAPPNKRAAALSVVTAAMMGGILMARLLSGVVTQYTSWRTIYWISVGLQYLIFILLFFFMPDYPSVNPGGLNYFKMLFSIFQMLTKHPILVQACLIGYFVSSTFTNYWTTATFLLSGPPYHYGPVIIGLFALIGIASMVFVPPWAKYVSDKFVPLFSVILSLILCEIGICIGTYTGTFTVAGPVIQAILNDFGMQSSQIANRSAIFTVEPKGRNRINTAYMIFTFAGQLTGTSVGARLYTSHGWIVSGSYSVAAIVAALVVALARGPWEEGWIGWHGGYSMLKKNKDSADGKPNEEAAQAEPGDIEKGGMHHDTHEHHHGRDNMEAVNATTAEKSLELRAAENVLDDDRESSKSSKDEISPAEKKL